MGHISSSRLKSVQTLGTVHRRDTCRSHGTYKILGAKLGELGSPPDSAITCLAWLFGKYHGGESGVFCHTAKSQPALQEADKEDICSLLQDWNWPGSYELGFLWLT